MAEIALRPYQRKFIDDVRGQFIAGKKRVVGVAPCGAGKTIMTGWMIRESLNRDKSSIFFVHRKELIEQASATFERLHIPHGIIAAGFKPCYDYPVQIASVQTLIQRLNFVPTPNFMICDECHHILAKSYKKIINRWKTAFLLGVTATPLRAGGITLSDVFQSMVFAPTTSQLIELGNLTNFRYVDGALADDNSFKEQIGQVGITQGDYNNSQLAGILIKQKFVGNAVHHYQNETPNSSAICYCVNVEHSKITADAFLSAGINAAHVDGETDKNQRDRIINDFRRGIIKVLCNAELFGEGFDVPNCDTVILSRPTLSTALFIQQSMRSMRPNPDNPNKKATIIDCVKNFERHGLPDDIRNWSLDVNKVKMDGVAPIKICPVCKTVVNAAVKICPVCKAVLYADKVVAVNSDSRTIYNSEQTKKAPVPVTSIINAPSSIEDFIKISEERGYQRSWAAFQALRFVSDFSELLHIAEVMNYRKGWAYLKAGELGISFEKRVAKNPLVC